MSWIGPAGGQRGVQSDTRPTGLLDFSDYSLDLGTRARSNTRCRSPGRVTDGKANALLGDRDCRPIWLLSRGESIRPDQEDLMRFRHESGVSGWALAMLLLLAGPARADSDPMGDTFGQGPDQQDITTYNAMTMGGRTTFSIDFANNIAAPSASATNSLVGYIDLDLDSNKNTGGNAPWGQDLQG